MPRLEHKGLRLHRSTRRHMIASAAAAIVSPTVLSHLGSHQPSDNMALGATFADSQTAYVHSPMPSELQYGTIGWPTAQGNLDGTRRAADSTISSGNVQRLELAWSLPLDADSGYGAITSNPLIVGNFLYLVDQQGNVSAVDRESGDVMWHKEHGVSTVGPNGLAIGDGVVVSVLGDTAEVVALTAETGIELWRASLTSAPGVGVTVAPVIYDGKVIVATAPGGTTSYTYAGGVTGSLFALDIQDGTVLWKWDTAPEDLWGNRQINTGGGIWYPPSIDEHGVLYVGTGNPGPFPGTEEYPNGTSRPGDNDFSNSLVAIQVSDGQLLWHLNVKPHDLFDHDNQLTPILANVVLNGEPTDVVICGGKHGYVVSAEREHGTELWRTAVGRHENDHLTELPPSYVPVFPGLFGGILASLAYHDGIVYAAVVNMYTEYNHTGYNYPSIDFGSATGELVALNVTDGRILWSVAIPSGPFGAGPTLSEDLVFIGTLDGQVRAYHARDGELQWTYQARAGLNAPFAISENLLLVPAGTVLIPAVGDDTGEVVHEPSLLAFKITT